MFERVLNKLNILIIRIISRATEQSKTLDLKELENTRKISSLGGHIA